MSSYHLSLFKDNILLLFSTNRGLYSPHCIFHSHSFFILWLEVLILNLTYLVLSSPPPTTSGNHLFILCFYDSAFIYLCSFVFQTSHICETYGIYLFLSDIPSRSIHVVADGKVSFFLWLIFHHVYIPNRLYPFIYFFQVLATINNAAMNLRVHISFCSSVFIFFG